MSQGHEDARTWTHMHALQHTGKVAIKPMDLFQLCKVIFFMSESLYSFRIYRKSLLNMLADNPRECRLQYFLHHKV